MSGGSIGASSRLRGASRNPGEKSVRQPEYVVHSEAINGRLDAIEASTAENGGRLGKVEDMVGYIRIVLDDIPIN